VPKKIDLVDAADKVREAHYDSRDPDELPEYIDVQRVLELLKSPWEPKLLTGGVKTGCDCGHMGNMICMNVNCPNAARISCGMNGAAV
jgi:hypothetical protein